MAERGDSAAPAQGRSWVARIAAALALVAAIAAIALIVSGSLGDDESSESSGNGGGKQARADEEPSSEETATEETGEELPETYEVQSGDSLSTIADEYGISVERLERLNPEVDPAALATGQTLKLR
jgi:teichoic acid transport system ATP-binding protein